MPAMTGSGVCGLCTERERLGKSSQALAGPLGCRACKQNLILVCLQQQCMVESLMRISYLGMAHKQCARGNADHACKHLDWQTCSTAPQQPGGGRPVLPAG